MKKPRWKAEEVAEFCGWEFLNRMISVARTDRDRVLIAVAFLTGGRVSEVLKLRKEHFDFVQNPTHVIVRTMPIGKRYRKIRKLPKWKCEGHCKMRWTTEPTPELISQHGEITQYEGWETRPVDAHRTFPFPKKESLVHILEEWVRGLGPEQRLIKLKYPRAYEITTDIGKILGTWIPTHWFRAQRASQLAFEYGFNEHDLVRFFDWKDYKTAFNYARKRYKELATKMVI